MTTEELEKLCTEELREKHNSNMKLLPQMVGSLYPSILLDENAKIRVILAKRGVYL